VANTQSQFNLVDSVAFQSGSHLMKFGADYRRIGTFNGPRAYDQFAYFNGAAGATSGLASDVVIDAQDSGSIHFTNLSLYAQDAWKATSRLTLTYGLRWEFNPPPLGGPGHPLYTFEGYANPKTIQLAPDGTPMYHASWRNFAPRLGAAYQLSRRPGFEATLRAGFGLFYDLGAGLIGQAASSFPYYRTLSYYETLYPLPAAAAQAPPFTLSPPVGSIYGAQGNLMLPVTYQWNLTMQQSLGRSSAISIGYVAAAGRHLLRQEYFVNPNDNFTYAYLLTNQAFSNFNSLQVQFQRRLSNGWQALISYTWSHSLDNASNDSASYLEALQLNPKLDYGPSDFDIRHTLSAAFTYALPGRHLLLRNWFFDGVVSLRTATLVDVTYSRDLGFGFYTFRPDLVFGSPLYLSDSNVAGGRRFNMDAFVLPTQYPGRQGTLGRNGLRGFPLNQIHFTIRREFPLVENAKLQF
ncbi:MAG: TonB-dependent receptor domain-containing protein, partial [Bryobacteraceae bacterium]